MTKEKEGYKDCKSAMSKDFKSGYKDCKSNSLFYFVYGLKSESAVIWHLTISVLAVSVNLPSYHLSLSLSLLI